MIAREMGSAWAIAESLYYLGLMARDRGEASRARGLWTESLAISQRLRDVHRLAECLEGLASLMGLPDRGEPGRGEPDSRGPGETSDRAGIGRRAARLLGAAVALRESAGTPVAHKRRTEYERQVAAVRAMLDAAAFAEAWAEGRAMTLDQAIDDALRGVGDVP